MVSTGHYLATAAGYRILEQGGNAIDAGVAAGIVINVTLPQYTSFGGVAPIIIHHAESGDTREISGLGRWPAEASIDYFRREHGGDMPHGVMRTVTPAAPDAWLTTLSRYGTMTFEQVVTPALELAPPAASRSRPRCTAPWSAAATTSFSTKETPASGPAPWTSSIPGERLWASVTSWCRPTWPAPSGA